MAQHQYKGRNKTNIRIAHHLPVARECFCFPCAACVYGTGVCAEESEPRSLGESVSHGDLWI